MDTVKDSQEMDRTTYETYVREKLAISLKAAEEGRIISHDEVKKWFLSLK